MVIKKTDFMFMMFIGSISFFRSCFLSVLFFQGTAYVRVHVTLLRLPPDNPDSSHRFASLSSPLLFVGAEPHSSNGPFLPLEVWYFSTWDRKQRTLSVPAHQNKNCKSKMWPHPYSCENFIGLQLNRLFRYLFSVSFLFELSSKKWSQFGFIYIKTFC